MAHTDEREHDPPLEGSAAQGRELTYWVAKAAAETRDRAQVPETAVAALAGVEPITVKRFERIERFPADLDAIMSAYALLAGLSDEREIYQRALQLWQHNGSSAISRMRPLNRHSQRFEQALIDAAQRSRPASGGERSEKPSSTRRRRANG